MLAFTSMVHCSKTSVQCGFVDTGLQDLERKCRQFENTRRYLEIATRAVRSVEPEFDEIY